jgi:lipopolysaccharide/colanic/teichoic acid biosynthesis glycosyltransferase
MLLKRLFDLALCVAAFPVVVPVMATLGVLARIFMGAPILIKQVRPGRDGRPFTMYKFRTMGSDRDKYGALLSDGARLTRFGRWLRATSLDELPELYNVVRGDMSLVGPRPLLMEYLPLYTPEQNRRHDVPPGLTGWAQVNGRNSISWDEKFNLDIWYVDHASLLLDLRIIWLTVLRVVRRDGISAAGEATMPSFTGTESSDQTNGAPD